MFGFGFEQYEITTQDGYILTLMRIPYGPDNQDEPNKQPILWMVPLFESTQVFDQIEADDEAQYRLANQGYDVWIYNIRGNIWSRRHEWLDPSTDREYWHYTLPEVRYDLIAIIDFITETTNYRNIHIFANSLYS